MNTLDVNHAGFSIPIPTHVTYENTEISFTVLADKEGFHYYDLRNMVLQTGHPLVAGDPRATIGNQYGLSSTEDTLEIRLRNQPSDATHHHWIIHNFHPIGIGELELTQDGSAFVEFDLKGSFTHITYDCGKAVEQDNTSTKPAEDEKPAETKDKKSGDDATGKDNDGKGSGEGGGGGDGTDSGDDKDRKERYEEEKFDNGENPETPETPKDKDVKDKAEPDKVTPEKASENNDWSDFNPLNWAGKAVDYAVSATTSVVNAGIEGASKLVTTTLAAITPEETP